MFEWIVRLKGKEYRVWAENRWFAIKEAVHRYKSETKDPEIVAILAALASAFKLGRGKRGEPKGAARKV